MKFAIPFLSLLTAFVLPLPAQDKSSADLEKHPAVQVVKDYLKFMLAQDWERSSALVEDESMKSLRDDYLARIKRSATLDEEKEIVEKFKLQRLEDMEKMAPRDFYVTYHRVLKDRHSVPEEVIQKVRDTMQLRVLSVGEENENLTHVLVRTKHANDKALIENLELISLVKQNGKWMVGLNEQVPKITPLEGAKPDPKSPDKAPAGTGAPKTGTGKTTPPKSGEKGKK